MDDLELWKIIEEVVRTGIETDKIDLKRELDLSGNPSRGEFAKDVSAISNKGKGQGYIIIGVLDNKQLKRIIDDPNMYICGFYPLNIDGLYQTMLQTLRKYVDPCPEIEYRELGPPIIPKKIGILVIASSNQRPHVIREDQDDERGKAVIRRGQIWTRHGSLSFPPDREEIITMTQDYWKNIYIELVR